jgi:hypothetical protein
VLEEHQEEVENVEDVVGVPQRPAADVDDRTVHGLARAEEAARLAHELEAADGEVGVVGARDEVRCPVLEVGIEEGDAVLVEGEPARHPRPHHQLHARVALHDQPLLARLVLLPPLPVAVQPLERAWEVELARLQRTQHVVLLHGLHWAADGRVLALGSRCGRGGGGAELLKGCAQRGIQLGELDSLPLALLADGLGRRGTFGHGERHRRAYGLLLARSQEVEDEERSHRRAQPHRPGLGAGVLVELGELFKLGAGAERMCTLRGCMLRRRRLGEQGLDERR